MAVMAELNLQDSSENDVTGIAQASTKNLMKRFDFKVFDKSWT